MSPVRRRHHNSEWCPAGTERCAIGVHRVLLGVIQ